MSGALCQCTLSKELLLWLCSALGWWVSTCDFHPLPGPSLQFPSSSVPKGWDTARSSWLRMLPSLWEPHLSTVHFLRKMVNICHFRQSCEVGANVVREKIAFLQQQAASLWQLQSGLWSSLSKPPGCNSSSRCRQEVALKNKHFTLKQSRLHQTQDIKKEEKKNGAAECTRCPRKVSTYTQTISNQPS